jgi:hypothetical protein
VFDQVVQDEIGIAGIALGPGSADALAIVAQFGGVHGKQMHMGILGEYGDQRPALLFQRQGDGPAVEGAGQFDGPYFYGFRGMLQFPASTLAVGGEHGPEVFLIGPVQTDACCVGRFFFCGTECGHVVKLSFRWYVVVRAGRTLFPRRPYSRVW